MNRGATAAVFEDLQAPRVSCIPEVVRVGSPGNIVTLGNRLGPTAISIPTVSRGSLLDPPIARGDPQIRSKSSEPGMWSQDSP